MVTDVSNGLSYPRLDCEAALAALPLGACPAAPTTGCRIATKSLLLLKDLADPDDKLVYKWVKGQATSQAEFADPTSSGDYTLCVYRGATDTPALEATVVGGTSAWQTVGDSGYKYLDAGGAVDGIRKVLLKGGGDDKAKVIVSGKGSELPDPDLSLFSAPVTVQVHNSDAPALCWESTFNSGDILTNDPTLFKAKRSN
jgi:hypothetical protein